MSYLRLDNGTVWPHPAPMTGDPETSIEWLLRISEAQLTPKQRHTVADILHAYWSLIMQPGRTEQDVARIVGEIREKLEESR